MGETGGGRLCSRGYTLIELMIAICISAIVVLGVYSFYDLSSRSYKTQDRVIGLMQNIREALAVMEQDILMAGYDPMVGDFRDTFVETAANPRPGFVQARPGGFQVIMNLDADGITDGGENITYGLSPAVDATCDGVPDAGGGTALQRDTGSGFQPLVEGMEAVRFAYAYDLQDVGSPGGGELEFNDANGNGIAEEGEIIWAYDSNNDGTLDKDTDGNSVNVNLSRIRAVRVWMLARTSEDKGFLKHTDNRIYAMGGLTRNYSGDNQDHFYRRFHVATIRCRNLGSHFRGQ